MNNDTLLKLLIVIGLLAISALPEFGKELFVDKTGKFGHPDLTVVILLTLGLYWDWKYIKQVIIVLCTLLFMSTIIMYFASTPFIADKPGYFIYAPILLTTIFITYRLMKLKAK